MARPTACAAEITVGSDVGIMPTSPEEGGDHQWNGAVMIIRGDAVTRVHSRHYVAVSVAKLVLLDLFQAARARARVCVSMCVCEFICDCVCVCARARVRVRD